MHVHQILGVGNHSKENVETVIQNLKEWKQYVCGWGGTQLKTKMVEVARRIKELEFTAAIKFNGNELSNFQDIKKWWRIQWCSRRKRTETQCITWHMDTGKKIKIGINF